MDKKGNGKVRIEPGQQLLHYRLLEKIVEGGMGVVWKAVDTTLDRQVAIKILPPRTSPPNMDRQGQLHRDLKPANDVRLPIGKISVMRPAKPATMS